MFKRVPGNREYRINLEGTVVDYRDNVVELKEEEDFIFICLYGKNVKIKRKLLALFAWYEYETVHNFKGAMKFLTACVCDSAILRVSCGHLFTHSKPIEYIDSFRYVPNYPRYAINIDGCIIDTLTSTIVDKTAIDDDGYAVAYIYNPDKGANRWTRIHRLMAFAWLPNTDFKIRPYVNHKDGIKANFKLSNLEWCSLEENAQHAFETGLNPATIAMKSRDILTGEIVHYYSAAELKKKLGMSNVSAVAWQYKLPGYLYQKRYEIKRATDNTSWFYENNDVESAKAIFTITVIDKITGEQKSFINVNSFKQEYKLRSDRNCLDDMIGVFKNTYPDLDVSYKRNSVIGPYLVIDTISGSSEEINSILEAAAVVEITRTELQYDLSRAFKFIYNKRWIVLPKASESNFNIEEYSFKRKQHPQIEVNSVFSGEIKIFKSAKEAASKIGIDSKSISKYLNTGNPFKGFTFRAIEQ